MKASRPNPSHHLQSAEVPQRLEVNVAKADADSEVARRQKKSAYIVIVAVRVTTSLREWRDASVILGGARIAAGSTNSQRPPSPECARNQFHGRRPRRNIPRTLTAHAAPNLTQTPMLFSALLRAYRAMGSVPRAALPVPFSNGLYFGNRR
jgi:hypothetical protein